MNHKDFGHTMTFHSDTNRSKCVLNVTKNLPLCVSSSSSGPLREKYINIYMLNTSICPLNNCSCQLDIVYIYIVAHLTRIHVKSPVKHDFIIEDLSGFL